MNSMLSDIEFNYENWTTNFPPLVVDNKDPLSVENLSKSLKKMKHEFVIPLSKTVFLSDERDVLEKVTTPCTIIQPSNDIVVPESVAYYMQKKIKGESTVEIVKADGHFPHLTAHLELLDVLGRVLGFEI